MRNEVNIEYEVHSLGDKNLYLGWATDYVGVIAQGDSVDEVRDKILTSLKVSFLYFVDTIDRGTIKTNIKQI